MVELGGRVPCLDKEEFQPVVNIDKWHVFTVGRCSPRLLVTASSTCPAPLQALCRTQDVSLVMMSHQQIILHNQHSGITASQILTSQ